MSNLGGGEILVVLLLALIVLGPDKLPEAARKVGDLVRQVRQMSQGFQTEVRKAMELDPGNVPFHPEEARIRPVPDPDTDSSTDAGPAADTGVDEGSEVRAVHPGTDAGPGAPGPPVEADTTPNDDDGDAGRDDARAAG